MTGGLQLADIEKMQILGSHFSILSVESRSDKNSTE